MFKRILLTTDGSPVIERALLYEERGQIKSFARDLLEACVPAPLV